ncbi:hypothetical protein OV450_6898 [Actinobacteria bacterium OV450]|nr:hypothetical protein OV450_6898 [Actinobacteria bacterium OV450]
MVRRRRPRGGRGDLADAVAAEITPDNTLDTYAKSWRVWTRFCAATDLPQLEGSRGSWWRSWPGCCARASRTGRTRRRAPRTPTSPAPSSACASAGSLSAATTRPRPARRWPGWRSSSCRPGSGAAATRPSAPTSTGCTPSPAPAPTPLPATGTSRGQALRPAWVVARSGRHPGPLTAPDVGPYRGDRPPSPGVAGWTAPPLPHRARERADRGGHAERAAYAEQLRKEVASSRGGKPTVRALSAVVYVLGAGRAAVALALGAPGHDRGGPRWGRGAEILLRARARPPRTVSLSITGRGHSCRSDRDAASW